MYISRSLQASAFLLSFSTLSSALAVVNNNGDNDLEQERGLKADNAIRRSDKGAAGEEQQALDCPNDRWQEFLDANPSPRIQTFCNEWLGLGPATSVVEVAPTV